MHLIFTLLSKHSNALLMFFSLQGYAWRSLDVSVEKNPEWRVFTRVLFGNRSDTGKPNNSPMTASLPIYKYLLSIFLELNLVIIVPVYSGISLLVAPVGILTQIIKSLGRLT